MTTRYQVDLRVAHTGDILWSLPFGSKEEAQAFIEVNIDNDLENDCYEDYDYLINGEVYE